MKLNCVECGCPIKERCGHFDCNEHMAYEIGVYYWGELLSWRYQKESQRLQVLLEELNELQELLTGEG